MQLDPTRWLVSLAGFVYDWIITREWRRVLLLMAPTFVLCAVALAAAWGKRLDRNVLAQWYMELGEEEIVDWEQAWAPSTSSNDGNSSTATSSQSPSGQGQQTSSAENDQPALGDDVESESKQVSQFAEMLFRRVQLLVPSDRSQFIIAATLAQRGALEQAKSMLAKIAPADGPGYAPAHALLAQFLLYELQMQENKSRATADQFLHHVSEARLWDRVPQSLLQAGSDLYMVIGNPTEALALMSQSAEHHPEDNFALAQRAKAIKNERVYEQAIARATEFLTGALADNPKDAQTRIRLAETYALQEDFDRAEQLLKDVSEIDRVPEIVRALSQLFLARYQKSFKWENNKLSVNMGYLDAAMRIDPANPFVAEEVVKLVKAQGPRPPDEMINLLKERLAEGSATAATHACLAEMRLLRHEYELAIPHLEQVINRLPNSAEQLNNLAFILAELHPERTEEALGYAMRAVAASTKQPHADYYDTLGFVLSKLDRTKEAITAFETAIELNRQRVDFHERVAAQYRKLGDEAMASMHEQISARLKTAAAESAAHQKQQADSQQPEPPRQPTQEAEAVETPSEDVVK